jgi:hypothetical protein
MLAKQTLAMRDEGSSRQDRPWEQRQSSLPPNQTLRQWLWRRIDTTTPTQPFPRKHGSKLLPIAGRPLHIHRLDASWLPNNPRLALLAPSRTLLVVARVVIPRHDKCRCTMPFGRRPLLALHFCCKPKRLPPIPLSCVMKTVKKL